MKKLKKTKVILLQLGMLFTFLGSNSQVITGFELKNVDGNKIALSSYNDKKAVVIIFSGNHCVYSKKYEDRIIAMAKTYSVSGVQFLLINSNNPKISEEEKFELMAIHAKEKGYTFPYLQDDEHTVSKQFGATKNPEAYLLISENGAFKIIYHGNIDDNALMAEKVSQKFLENAIEKVLSGSAPEKAVTETVGCIIREM